MIDATCIVCLLLGFFLVAALYSSVGHAGASGYIAVMSLLSVPVLEIRVIALALNVGAALVTTVVFARAGHLRRSLLVPLVVASFPAAYLGARLPLDPRVLRSIIGAALVLSAVRLAVSLPVVEVEPTPPRPLALAVIGFAVGVVAGVTGTGGGVFLSPVLLLARWSGVRETSATAAAFILINSIAGLLGASAAARPSLAIIAAGLAVVSVGAVIGSRIGARRLGAVWTRRVLASVLVIAATKLVL